MSNDTTVESQAFYELMQTYRHSPIVPFSAASDAYQAVIQFVNEFTARQVQETIAREREEYDEDEDEDVPRAIPEATFLKCVRPSDHLAAIVGKDPLPRTEVTKKVWDYIKQNNLQDAHNRRMINSDEKLKEVFGGKAQVSLFEMTKLISNHLS